MKCPECRRARAGGLGTQVVQEGMGALYACRMAHARWAARAAKGRNGTGGVTSSTGFLPAGWRSEVAREIAFGHVLGHVYPIKFFFSFFIVLYTRPKTAFLTKKIGSRFARSISGRRTKGIFVTRFLFEGLGSQKRGFGADFRPCQK